MNQPEKQSTESLIEKPLKSNLLLAERPLVVQIGLRDLFGYHEAEFVQHLNYCRHSPFFDKLLRKEVSLAHHEGRVFTNIPARLMFDPWTGYMRDSSESTFRRTVASCKKQGIVLTADRLDEDQPTDNTNWYALVDEVVGPLTGIYQEYWERVLRERQEALIGKRRPPSEAQESQIKREMREKIAEMRKQLEPVIERIREMNAEQDKPKKGVNGSPCQNDTITQPKEPFASVKSKRQGRPIQNDRVEPRKTKGSSRPKRQHLYIKKTIESKDSEITIGAPAARDVVDETSIEFLSEAAPSTRDAGLSSKAAASSPKAGGAAPTEEPTLPSTAAQSAGDDAVPHAVQDTAQRMLALAEESARQLDVDGALRLARTSEISAAGKAQLKRLLTSDHAKAGLSAVVGGQALHELQEDADRLRWALFSWPAHRAGVLEYYQKKGKKPDLTGAFIRKFREDEAPPIEWLDALLRADNIAQWKIQQAQETRAAAEFWATLNGEQQRAFENDLRRNPLKKDGAWLAPGSPEYELARTARLNDAEVRARILGAENEKSAPSGAPEAEKTASENEGADDNWMPHPNVVKRCEKYASDFLRKLKSGEMDDADLEKECGKIAGLGARESTWLTEMVRAESQQRQALAA